MLDIADAHLRKLIETINADISAASGKLGDGTEGIIQNSHDSCNVRGSDKRERIDPKIEEFRAVWHKSKARNSMRATAPSQAERQMNERQMALSGDITRKCGGRAIAFLLSRYSGGGWEGAL
jgi:hypothetical protein